jgi:hypothetical protein
MQIKKPVTLFFAYAILFFQCCNIGADKTEKLSGGYFFRNEGGEIKDILCKRPNGGEIPATVIAYAYDKNFIIAEQKPKIPQDPLYSKDYEYKNGIDSNYYWVIVHKDKIILGPLDSDEYELARGKYNVPESLKLEEAKSR